MLRDEQPEPKSRILIVDDIPANIRVLGPVLREADYQVYVARDGNQALKMVSEIEPDLILLDIMMPGLDGFDTCKRLKEQPETCDIPVIFLSARIDKEDVVKGFNIGAVDYVTKPFIPSILQARIKTHLTLRQQARKLQSLAEKDGLTLVANRRRFDDFFQREWRRCRRNQRPLSIIMLDIDYFKLYNDTYGHLQGDETLKQVADVVQQVARRPGDLAARYGGEEFVVVLSEVDTAGAAAVADNILAKVTELQIPHQASTVAEHVTVSLGVASRIPKDGMDPVAVLLQAADSELYRAKHAGRNQVKVAA